MLRVRLASVLCLMAACGCSAEKDRGLGDRPARVPVEGQVLYQGKPIAGANVFFELEDNSRSAFGVTDPQGRFQLTTYDTGDGAVPGRHRVWVDKTEVETKPVPPGSDDPNLTEIVIHHARLPKKYGNPRTSGLTADVMEKKPNNFVFRLVD